MRRLHFLIQKLRIFRNLRYVCTDIREEEFSQCRQGWGGGKGSQFFVILCGRPLWTASYAYKKL